MTVRHRVIGLIGGMSWESSALYYRLLNREMAAALGGHHNARSILVTVDFDDVLKPGLDGNWSAVGDIVTGAARAIENAGGECIVLTANTAHIVADDVASAVALPLLHIADAVGSAIRAQSMKKVGLLGTRQTLESGLYDRVMAERYEMEVELPGERDRDALQAIILDELTKGQLRASSRTRCFEIVDRLAHRGAEGVIVGCTELPLLLEGEDTSVPQFDTTRLHVAQAVAFALAKSHPEMSRGIGP